MARFMTQRVEPQQDSPDVRRRILATATALFAKIGYESTSLQAIAEQVGIRKASLLYHFPSKDALRQAVLQSLTQRWKERLPQLLLAANSGEDRFSNTMNEALAFFRSDRARARLLMRELLDRPGETRALLHESLGPWLELVARFIRRGQKEGLIWDDVDPVAYVAHVIAMVVGGFAVSDMVHTALATSGSDGGGDPGDRQAKEIVRLARAALFTPTPTST